MAGEDRIDKNLWKNPLTNQKTIYIQDNGKTYVELPTIYPRSCIPIRFSMFMIASPKWHAVSSINMTNFRDGLEHTILHIYIDMHQ